MLFFAYDYLVALVLLVVLYIRRRGFFLSVYSTKKRSGYVLSMKGKKKIARLETRPLIIKVPPFLADFIDVYCQKNNFDWMHVILAGITLSNLLDNYRVYLEPRKKQMLYEKLVPYPNGFKSKRKKGASFIFSIDARMEASFVRGCVKNHMSIEEYVVLSLYRLYEYTLYQKSHNVIYKHGAKFAQFAILGPGKFNGPPTNYGILNPN